MTGWMKATPVVRLCSVVAVAASCLWPASRAAAQFPGIIWHNTRTNEVFVSSLEGAGAASIIANVDLSNPVFQNRRFEMLECCVGDAVTPIWLDRKTGEVLLQLTIGPGLVLLPIGIIEKQWQLLCCLELNPNEPLLIWRHSKTGHLRYWLFLLSPGILLDSVGQVVPREWEVVCCGIDGLTWRNTRTGALQDWLLTDVVPVVFPGLPPEILVVWTAMNIRAVLTNNPGGEVLAGGKGWQVIGCEFGSGIVWYNPRTREFVAWNFIDFDPGVANHSEVVNALPNLTAGLLDGGALDGFELAGTFDPFVTADFVLLFRNQRTGALVLVRDLIFDVPATDAEVLEDGTTPLGDVVRDRRWVICFPHHALRIPGP